MQKNSHVICGETLLYLLFYLPFFTLYPSIAGFNVRLETIVFAVFLFLFVKNFFRSFKTPKFALAYFCFIGILGLSVAQSTTRIDAIVGARTFLAFALIYLTYSYFYAMGGSINQFLHRIYKHSAYFSIILSLIGFLVFYDYNVDIHGNDYATLSNPIRKGLYMLISHESRGRHIWANYLNLLIIIQGCLILAYGKKINLIGFLSLFATEMLLSVRTAILSCFIALIFSTIIWRKQRIGLTGIVLGLLLVFSAGYGVKRLNLGNYQLRRIQESIPTLRSFQVDRIEDVNFSTIGQRIQAIVITLNEWPNLSLRKKLCGWGFGSFKKASGWSIHSHNSYIEFLFNFGIFGLVTFSVFMLSAIRTSIRRISLLDINQKIAIISASGFTISLLISSFAGDYFLSSTAMFPLFILIGGMLSIKQEENFSHRIS